MAAETALNRPIVADREDRVPRALEERTAAPALGVDVGWKPSSLSFQNRIAVVALITAVAVLLTACFMFMLAEWRTERAQFLQNQSFMAQIAASHARRAMIPPDLPRLRLNLAALESDPRIRGAEVDDLQGRPLAVFERPPGTKPPAGDPVQTQAAIVIQGKTVGQVVVRSTAEGFSSLFPRFVSLGGALFFVAAGLALFMGRWLAGSLAKPVERLSRAMQDVAASGDFSRRVERVADDEFGRLTDSFNDLLVQLHKNDRELRQAMADLVEARDAAEAANVLKSHFLANMSHEIRTPLNGVLAMAQIMEMGELRADQRERLGVIRRSGEALLAVLNDVLDLSKIEAGRMELETVEFDMAELMRELDADFAPLAREKGLAFDVEVRPAAGGLRRGDPARLRQILNNLLSNAVKFTSTGEVRVIVDGEGEDGADGIRASVADSGIGIPAEKLPLLFQKFTQVDSSTTRQFGGTGLGLAICRELAQLMGGKVWGESLQGVGSTFFASLPLARAPVARTEAEASEGSAAAREVSSLSILAAEDNATNQLVLRTVLASFGLEVDLVADGRQAVEAWRERPYDVILMDIQMPGMDGIAATRAIRTAEAETSRRRTPIIALSANAMTHQVKEYLAAGMDMHVAKPIQLARLQEALERVITADPKDAAAVAV